MANHFLDFALELRKLDLILYYFRPEQVSPISYFSALYIMAVKSANFFKLQLLGTTTQNAASRSFILLSLKLYPFSIVPEDFWL
jgi:hypothetical protein